MSESSYVMRVEARNASRGRKTSSKIARSRARAGLRKRARSGSWTVALALLTFAIFLAHLPLIRDPIDVRPDGAEYLGIARHFAWEGRWESDIKWHFTTNE